MWWCEWVSWCSIHGVSDVLVWVSDGVNEWCVMVWVSVGLLVNRECMTLHDRNIMIVLFIARLRKQKWISFLQEIPYQNNGEVMSFISQGKHTASQLQSVDSANHSYIPSRPQCTSPSTHTNTHHTCTLTILVNSQWAVTIPSVCTCTQMVHHILMSKCISTPHHIIVVVNLIYGGENTKTLKCSKPPNSNY